MSEKYRKVVYGNRVDSWRSFVVAISAALMQAFVFGIVNSFSIYVWQMSNDESLGNPGEKMLSIAKGVSAGIGPLFAIFAGRLSQAVGTRITCYISVVALVIALQVTARYVKTGEGIIGVYGLFAGLSVAFMICPGAAATSTWFQKYSSFGMGICFAGGGVGSLTIPFVAGALSKHYGWRRCFQYLSAFGAAGLIFATFVCMRPLGMRTQYDEDVDDEEVEDLSTTPSPGKNIYRNDNETKTSDNNSKKLHCCRMIEDVDADAIPPLKEGEPTRYSYYSEYDKPKHDIVRDDKLDAQHEKECLMGDDTQAKVEYREKVVERTSKTVSYDQTEELSLHYHKCNLKEWFTMIILTKDFLALFFSYMIFSFAFYGFLFIAVMYPNAMGSLDPYKKYEKIDILKASTLFTPFGVIQVVSSPLLGMLANKTSDRWVFLGCILMTSLATAFMSLSRTYASFVFCFIFMGMGIAGFFATYTAMVAKRFWGPNLGTTIGLEFSAASLGGFFGPYCVTVIKKRFIENYTPVCVILGVEYLLAGTIVLALIRELPKWTPHCNYEKQKPAGNGDQKADKVNSNEPDNTGHTVKGTVTKL